MGIIYLHIYTVTLRRQDGFIPNPQSNWTNYKTKLIYQASIGNLDVEDFHDWIKNIENFLDYKNTWEEKVALKLKGGDVHRMKRSNWLH